MIRNLPRTGECMFSNWKHHLKKYCLEFYLLVSLTQHSCLEYEAEINTGQIKSQHILNNLVDSLWSVCSVPGRPWTWRVSGHSYIVRSKHRCLVLSTQNKDYLVVNFCCNCILFCSFESAAAAAKSLQSCPTLCDPTDGSPPGSPVPGILQARTLEWVAIAFSYSLD